MRAQPPASPPNPGPSPADRALLLSRFCFFGLAWILVLGLATSLWLNGEMAGVARLALPIAGLAFLGICWGMRRGMPLSAAAPILGIVAFATILSIALSARDFPVVIALWNIVIPVSSALLRRRRAAAAWTLVIVAETVFLYVRAASSGGAEPDDLGEAISLVAFLLLGIAFAVTTERIRAAAEARGAQLREHYEQLLRLQRMGDIAGAVAHDFNNLLTVVQTYAALMLDEVPEDDPRVEDLREILGACERGVVLTGGLRTFAQDEPSEPVALDLAEALRELGPALQRLAGEPVALTLGLPPALGPVSFHPTQLEQMLAILVLNARDAMPEGGELELVADVVKLDTDEQKMGLATGVYARLRVIDRGVGMPSDVLRRVFEPFFSTKPRGRATGLGLSTAYGMVRAAGGDLRAESVVGEGSTFTALLPLTARHHTGDVDDGRVPLVRKPFTPDQLLAAVSAAHGEER